MAHRTIRGFVLAGLAAAGMVAALPAAPAQEDGDTVVIVLKSGKKYTCTLISRNEATVRIRVGTSEMSLPASMVTSVESVSAPSPAPEPAPSGDEPRSQPGSAGGGSAGGASGSGAPKGASLVLKDGRVLEGFVVAKEKGRLWFVPGKVVSIAEADIEESFGNVEPAGGRGLSLTGEKGADATRMVEELNSGDKSRVAAAWAILQGMGNDAIPALVAGLRSPTLEGKELCIEQLTNLQARAAVEPLFTLLRNDPDVRVRCSVAGRLTRWESPGARRAILDAVWQDRDESVKVTGLLGLEKACGPEEVSSLIDLMTILPNDSGSRGALFRVLKVATGEKFGPDASVWMEWWNNTGREVMAEKADAAARARYKKEMDAKFGASPDEVGTGPVEGPPADALKTEPEPPPPGETPPAEPPK